MFDIILIVILMFNRYLKNCLIFILMFNRYFKNYLIVIFDVALMMLYDVLMLF